MRPIRKNGCYLIFKTRKLENHDPFQGIVAIEEVIAFDFVVEVQFIHGHQISDVFIGGVVEKKGTSPWDFRSRTR